MYELPMLTSRSVSFPYLISFHLFPCSLLKPPLKVSHLHTVPQSLSEPPGTHFHCSLESRQTPLDSIQEFSIRPPRYSTHYSPPTNLFLIWVFLIFPPETLKPTLTAFLSHDDPSVTCDQLEQGSVSEILSAFIISDSYSLFLGLLKKLLSGLLASRIISQSYSCYLPKTQN